MPDDSPTLSEIERFIESASKTMTACDLSSIKVKQADTKIVISRGGLSPLSGEPAPRQNNAPQPRDTQETGPAQPDLSFDITAPMIGTFYAAASPGEPPLIQPGERVESGQVIGIIEAMKIMNEIVADRAGVVEEVLVANAQTVEYGQPLMRLSPTPAE